MAFVLNTLQHCFNYHCLITIVSNMSFWLCKHIREAFNYFMWPQHIDNRGRHESCWGMLTLLTALLRPPTKKKTLYFLKDPIVLNWKLVIVWPPRANTKSTMRSNVQDFHLECFSLYVQYLFPIRREASHALDLSAARGQVAWGTERQKRIQQDLLDHWH